jgi:hypothetical protein
MDGKCFCQKHFSRDRARLPADAKRLGQPLTQPRNKKAALMGGLRLGLWMSGCLEGRTVRQAFVNL